MRRVTLTREELHRRVWSSPMRAVAAEIGISDVGLAKACKRHNIPTPKQGHWLRKESKRHTTPLPESAGYDDLVSLDLKDPGFKAKVREAKRIKTDVIDIPPDLTGAHPLVVATEEAARGMRFDEGHGKKALDITKKHLDIRVSPKQFERSLRIASALIYASEAAGAMWTIDDKGATWVTFDSQKIHVRLIEKMRRVAWPYEPAPASKRGVRTEPNWDALHPRTKLVGTGHVEFKIESYLAAGVRSHWGGSKRPLESELASIVASLPVVAAALKAHDEEHRAQALAREQKRQARINVAREAEIGKIQRERLSQTAQAWQGSATIRAYCAAIAEQYENQDLSDEERLKLDEWLAWANDQADSMDPLSSSITSLTERDVVLPTDFDSKVRHPLWDPN